MAGTKDVSLYDDLGVLPGADAETIKKAYRRKAQSAHPDKDSGTTEAFQAIEKAYSVLSDPERRKQYDATGETMEPNTIGAAHDAIRMMLLEIVETCQDITHVNLVEQIRRAAVMRNAQCEGQIPQLRLKIKKREAVRDRIVKKIGGDNLLAATIDHDIAQIERKIAGIEHDIELGKLVVQILDGYGYRCDPATIFINCTTFTVRP